MNIDGWRRADVEDRRGQTPSHDPLALLMGYIGTPADLGQRWKGQAQGQNAMFGNDMDAFARTLGQPQFQVQPPRSVLERLMMQE